MAKSSTRKGRKASTAVNVERRLTKFYNGCPKLQKKISLQDWLKQIKGSSK